jgi:hypothetical protein
MINIHTLIMEDEYQTKQAFSAEATEELSDDQQMLKEFEGDEDVDECAECNGAIREKAISREIDDEMLKFCSKECADDYEEEII